MTFPGRMLGIDHGLKRIGVAVCDATGLVAREVIIIERRSKREDFEVLRQLVEEHQAVAFVVGLPNVTDAVPGQFTQADKVRNWVGYLQAAIPLPVILRDEQFSSIDAAELAQMKGRKAQAPIDDLAARLILQGYLDAVREGLAPAPDI